MYHICMSILYAGCICTQTGGYRVQTWAYLCNYLYLYLYKFRNEVFNIECMPCDCHLALQLQLIDKFVSGNM